MVKAAFDSVEDPIGSGSTTFETLESEINVNNDQGAEDLLNEMDRQIEERSKNNASTITYNEFVEYYRTLSSAVDGDRKFETVLRATFPGMVAKSSPKPSSTMRRGGARSNGGSRQSTSRQNNSRGGGARGGGSRGGSRSGGARQQQEENDALARFRREKKRPDLASNKGMIRLGAAAKLQAIFRGHKGRTKVDYEKRKQKQIELKKAQDDKERDAAARRVKRTQPKHNPRFKAARR